MPLNGSRKEWSFGMSEISARFARVPDASVWPWIIPRVNTLDDLAGTCCRNNCWQQ